MESATPQELLDLFERRVWITRGARFNASRRLGSKQYWSVASISFLSVYGISMPILQSNLDSSICPEIIQTYSVIATVLSVFILVLGLLEGYRNYQVKAIRLHANALDLSHICREIEFLKVRELQGSELLKELELLSKKYEELIKDCQENHDIEDFMMFKSQNRQYFKISRNRAALDRLFLWIKDYWLYFISITAFPLPIVLLYLSC
jgi:hypothetical protein